MTTASDTPLQPKEEDQMSSLRIEHVNITVADPERTAALMEALFDWCVRWSGRSQNGGHTVHVGSAEHYLALHTPGRTAQRPEPFGKGRPLNHIGLEVDDLDATEARVIAEDLVQHDRSSDAHVRRLRAALELLGVADIDRVIEERLNPEESLSMLPDDLDLNLLETIEAPATPLVQPSGHLRPPQPVTEPEEAFIEETLFIEETQPRNWFGSVNPQPARSCVRSRIPSELPRRN